ncbi:ABC transporter permease [Colwellia sp. KU-HH00111]|uniref:ABC transporter permease n=1 Tax=Colwellia sp. KU-HH00111 TaxID=3127652 RepID=UPI003104CCA3
MNLWLLVWRNSLRKKIRFGLTCLSVMVAFFLFTTLAGVNHALTASVSNINQYRLITSHKISLTRSLPINYQQKIATLHGVEQVTFASWFGGFYQNEKNQLAVTAVDHTSYFELFDEYHIPEQQLASWKKARTGIIIGHAIAKEYGWRVGDKVPLSSSIWMNKNGSFSWEFVVSGIYQSTKTAGDNNKIFFQHAYFDKGRAYASHSISWLSTKIAVHENVEQVIKSIDDLFAHSNSPTRTTTEQVFIKEQAQQFVDMAMVINIVVIAVFFTLLLIVCNTMIQTSRERLNESAMMKALGFSSSALIRGIYCESLLLIGIGAALGTVLASVLLVYVKQGFGDFLPGIYITSAHYITVLSLVNIAAAFCSFFPAITINGIAISETLGGKS